MECELLRSPMISYRSLLYITTVLYDSARMSTQMEFQRHLFYRSRCIKLWVYKQN